MYSTYLPFETLFGFFSVAQLYVLVIGTVVSFLFCTVLIGSLVVVPKLKIRNLNASMVMAIGIADCFWCFTVFAGGTHELFQRYSTSETHQTTEIVLTIIAVIHAWVQWSSWILSAVIALSVVIPSMAQRWHEPRFRRVVWSGVWFSPVLLLIALICTAAANGNDDDRPAHVQISPIMEGVLLVSVFLIVIVCIIIIARRLHLSWSTVSKFLYGTQYFKRRSATRAQHLRMFLFLLPFLVCWTCPAALMFHLAFAPPATGIPNAIVWVYAAVTPYYGALSFAAFSSGRFKRVFRTFLMLFRRGVKKDAAQSVFGTEKNEESPPVYPSSPFAQGEAGAGSDFSGPAYSVGSSELDRDLLADDSGSSLSDHSACELGSLGDGAGGLAGPASAVGLDVVAVGEA